jgi:hypothetical protein
MVPGRQLLQPLIILFFLDSDRFSLTFVSQFAIVERVSSDDFLQKPLYLKLGRALLFLHSCKMIKQYLCSRQIQAQSANYFLQVLVEDVAAVRLVEVDK